MTTEQIESQYKSCRESFLEKIDAVSTNADLDILYLEYLGRKGVTTNLLKLLKEMSAEDKKQYGPIFNKLRTTQESALASQRETLSITHTHEVVDLTIPGVTTHTGRLHPTTTIIREMNEFFRYLGFSIGEGPELEDVEYNFRRLNLPEGHPATDLQDSLFVKEPQYLMRTHTSSVETRMLSEYHDKLPLRVVVPGKCYRNETNSATNTSFFYQYQGFVVDKGITI